MATRPILQPVPDTMSGLTEAVRLLNHLRDRIDALVGAHDGIDITPAKGEFGLDLTIHCKVNTNPERILFALESQPIEGVLFTKVNQAIAPKAHHRKLVQAFVAPEAGAA